MNTRVILDPTSERAASMPVRAPRLLKLDGATIGLVDISKPRGDVFLDRVAESLSELGATVMRYRKPTFTKIAPLPLRQRIAGECDAMVIALAD